jgi:hypothetical protein
MAVSFRRPLLLAARVHKLQCRRIGRFYLRRIQGDEDGEDFVAVASSTSTASSPNYCR